jgi:hypothetical protein
MLNTHLYLLPRLRIPPLLQTSSEDGRNTLPRNLNKHVPDYAVSHNIVAVLFYNALCI